MFDRGRTVRLGRRFEETDRLREALHEYEKLVAIDSGDVSALRRIADIEQRLGHRTDAVDTQEKLAEALAKKGHRLAALHRYKKVLELRAVLPTDPEGGRARIEAAIARLKAAIKEQRRALAAHDEIAQSLERKGKDRELADVLTQMVALEPDNPVVQVRLAETLCRLDRVDEALPAFRAACRALLGFDRTGDAVKVLERIFHFRVEPDDALVGARLYLERGEQKDAVRAVGKLQASLTHDPENLDALALLARAFFAMGQPARCTQVRVEMARIAKEFGEIDLLRDLLAELVETAPDDPIVRALSVTRRPITSSAPQISVRGSFASVIEEDVVALAEEVEEAPDSSVLDDLDFDEDSVLSEVWLMPVVSKEAKRALDEAEAFLRLRLHHKAEDVLLVAIEADPVCGELREALREVYRDRGDSEGFVGETLVLADLYRQRRFFDRARTLLSEVLEVDPDHAEALSLWAEIDASNSGARALPR